MSRSVELSDEDFKRLEEETAAADGMPLDAWVVANLPLSPAVPVSTEAPSCPDVKPARTMADLFAGRVGLVASGGDGRLSENTGKRFADHLAEQRRTGRL